MSLLPGAGTGQGTGQRLQGRLWSPLSWVLLCLPLPISFPQHHFSTWAWHLLGHLGHPKRSFPRGFFCTAGTLPVPPHLSELEDASCADILGRGHLDWAVLPVLIQLQDLNPQLHFAGHLTPPAQWVKCWVVSFVWLFFSPQEKKELKHQNTELRLQIEAATTTAVNAPCVSTQVPAVQCF